MLVNLMLRNATLQKHLLFVADATYAAEDCLNADIAKSAFVDCEPFTHVFSAPRASCIEVLSFQSVWFACLALGTKSTAFSLTLFGSLL